MRIASDGDVGIGTSTPTAKLDVVGTMKATSFVGDGSDLTGISALDGTKVLKSGDTMTGSLIFGGVVSDITTATGEHLALMPSGSGNVGVGVTTPGAKLDVSGNLRAAGTIRSTSGGFVFPDGTSQVSGALTEICTGLGARPDCDLAAAVQQTAWTRIYVVDAYGDTGRESSIIVGNDGYPIISYADETYGFLRVAHCNDDMCVTADITVPSDPAEVARFTSMAMGADGYPVIAYYDDVLENLVFVKCEREDCVLESRNTVDNAGNIGAHTSVAIGTDGMPVISYFDLGNRDLKFAHCNDAVCGTAATKTLDSAVNVGYFTSMAIGNDGYPVISYHDDTNNDLKYIRCGTVDCASWSTIVLDSGGSVGEYTSLAIGSDGLPVISYVDTSNHNLKVVHCGNDYCTGWSAQTVDSSGDIGGTTAIAVGQDGFPIIAYYDETNRDLKVARCEDIYCTTAVIETLDSEGDVGVQPSMAIGTDGLPVISYYDWTNGDLKVASHVVVVGSGTGGMVLASAREIIPGGLDPAGRLNPGKASPGSAAAPLETSQGSFGRAGMTPGIAAGYPGYPAKGDGTGGLSAPMDEEGHVYARSFRPSATDLASLVAVSESVEAGDVLVIDAEATGLMSLARIASDSSVFGIVAIEPGIILGAKPPDAGTSESESQKSSLAETEDLEEEKEFAGKLTQVPVTLSGVAFCKVDAGYGPILPGDLLTTSPTPGHAMRADDPQPGTILGKALEPLDHGTGLVKVLVMLR
jgi:hypothetical protein